MQTEINLSVKVGVGHEPLLEALHTGQGRSGECGLSSSQGKWKWSGYQGIPASLLPSNEELCLQGRAVEVCCEPGCCCSEPGTSQGFWKPRVLCLWFCQGSLPDLWTGRASEPILPAMWLGRVSDSLVRAERLPCTCGCAVL